MNEERFSMVMHSLDDELLEEAQRRAEHRKMWIKITAGAVAACLCLVAVWALAGGRGQNKGRGNTVTAAEITQLGYSLPLPADAKKVAKRQLNAPGHLVLSQLEIGGLAGFTREAAATFDRHIHPAEPRTLRLTVSHRF